MYYKMSKKIHHATVIVIDIVTYYCIHSLSSHGAWGVMVEGVGKIYIYIYV